MNARKTFLGLAGVALIAATGLFASACGNSSPNPAPSGSTSGGTGASAGSSTGSSGTTSGTSGTTSGAGTGASGASSGTTSVDGGPDATLPTADAGDAGVPEAAACNPTGAMYPADACTPCATNLLNACSTFNVTCISFDNSVIPPDAGF
jgi:hypothetical protein